MVVFLVWLFGLVWLVLNVLDRVVSGMGFNTVGILQKKGMHAKQHIPGRIQHIVEAGKYMGFSGDMSTSLGTHVKENMVGYNIENAKCIPVCRGGRRV